MGVAAPPRDMFVRSVDYGLDPALRARMISFASAHAVSTIYLRVGDDILDW